jgi:hypothetical protein
VEVMLLYRRSRVALARPKPAQPWSRCDPRPPGGLSWQPLRLLGPSICGLIRSAFLAVGALPIAGVTERCHQLRRSGIDVTPSVGEV